MRWMDACNGSAIQGGVAGAYLFLHVAKRYEEIAADKMMI